ncbi:hypothetical protein HDU81_001038 [Chytriomyces hyalinus]|nr:hypothetical protein HDU81_001038 [Chytriomyces hyalinus]
MELWKAALDVISIDPIGNMAKATAISIIVHSAMHLASGPKKSTKVQTSHIHEFLTAFKISAIGIVALYSLAVLFGAPFLRNVEKTVWLVLLMVSLSVFPAGLAIGAKTASVQEIANVFGRKSSRVASLMQTRILFTLLGAWIGSIFLPMDWNVKWKFYPIPVAVGATIGALAGGAASMLGGGELKRKE